LNKIRVCSRDGVFAEMSFVKALLERTAPAGSKSRLSGVCTGNLSLKEAREDSSLDRMEVAPSLMAGHCPQ
jgi:hypothetical protein